MDHSNKRYFVFNATDGLRVSPLSLTQAQASEVVAFVRRYYENLGFYQTRRGERVAPKDLSFMLIDTESAEGRKLAQNRRGT